MEGKELLCHTQLVTSRGRWGERNWGEADASVEEFEEQS